MDLEGRYEFVPLAYERPTPETMLSRARGLREELTGRRSVRHFSSEPVPEGVIEECIRAAGLAPSGANRQPWNRGDGNWRDTT